MSQTINVNGESINYPETGDTNWGDEATQFAIQTSAALGKIGLSSGTSVDIASTLDVTGATTLDSTLTVAGTTTLNGTANLNGNTNLGNAITDTVTVTGIVNVDSGVLYVDPTNNRVGINDTTPSVELDVNGSVAITGQALTGDGTALLPGISFFNDSNTGLYRIGSDNIGFSTNGSNNGQITTSGWIINQQYACFVDEKSNNTAGGTFTTGDWRTRVLNTTRGTNSITGSSLSSNQFTLLAGTYRIYAIAPAYYVNNHKAKLKNITDGVDVIIGTNERSAGPSLTDATMSSSIVAGRFTISATKTFELQHQCSSTRNNDGFGLASNFNVVETYTIVELWRIS